MHLLGFALMLSASEAGPSALQGWLPYLTGGSGALAAMAAGLMAFYTNRIHSDKEFQGVAQDRDRLIGALDNEKEAHQKTRDALALANARADQGIRSAEIIATALQLQGKKD